MVMHRVIHIIHRKQCSSIHSFSCTEIRYGGENCRNQKNKINSSRIRAVFWYKKEEPERMPKIKIELQGVCSPSAENKH